MEYLEDMNLYMCDTNDGILDILLDPCYSRVFKQELKSFLESQDTCFAFVGDVRTSDPSSQGVLMIKANEGLDTEPNDDGIMYLESIANASDIYHKIKRKEKKLGDFFKPYMDFIKTNFA